jgi:hypothetical protein
LNFRKNPPFQFAGALLFVVKNLPKTCANRPPNVKCTVPAFFGERFEGKEGSLRAQELGIKKDFCSGLGL